jgi:5-methylcytosine-specific restriction endonuclease McrA
MPLSLYLPPKKGLPVNLLAACFNNTSATYKYYWFLSILQAVETGSTRILKKHLFAKMISNAWFTVNYFNVSFGKQDKLQRAIENLRDLEHLRIDEERNVIFKKLISITKKESLDQLNYFNKQVPHWFLSPWFPGLSRQADVYQSSRGFKQKCLYELHEDEIIVNPEWVDYLVENSKLLKDFCYWNLTLYLQDRNPNVPDIPNKLIKPAERNSLVRQRKTFWDLVFNELGSLKCMYTGKRLTIGNYAVEHFIPYSFVAHDLIWNLIPADQSFNSAKGNKLPDLEKYITPFFNLHKSAIQIVRDKDPNNRFLEDYLTIFSDLNEVNDLDENFTKGKFKERLQPLITIASNNGFEFFLN